MPDPARLELLADHLELVPLLGRWHSREWGDEDDDGSEAAWTEIVRGRAGRDEVPFTLVAFLGDDPVGCLALCWDDADEEFADDEPWLSGMFVLGAARNLGIGRQLLEAVETKAAAMGHRTLWAHTGESESFYVRCGWELVRPKEPLRRDAVVRRELG